MGTLLIATAAALIGMALTSVTLFIAADPGRREEPQPPTKTVWVPVGQFFMNETGQEKETPATSRLFTQDLEEHVRREHAAAAKFLAVLTPESLHAPIDPAQMD